MFIRRLPTLSLAEPIARLGSSMQRHRHFIQVVQWIIVSCYLCLIIIPAFLPIPARGAHILNNLSLFAQFMFWGLWWPFVILSMLLLGRSWCGVFCPEGALTEWTSTKFGRNSTIPRWLKWRGWPCVAFILTTVYGQLVSVYDYAGPTLVILGGSTLAAMGIGFLYGRGTRVWCRYLCPVAGVFNMLSRLSPLSFKSNETAWRGFQGERPANPNCPPMIKIRHLNGVSACHMCGRCAGYRDAITLQPRPFNEEVVTYGTAKSNIWEMRLLLYGMIGCAIGAFGWSSSYFLIVVKQKMASFLVRNGIFWPLESAAPWWILTNYPQVGDHFNWLDGLCISIYIFGSGFLFGWILSLVLSLIGHLTHEYQVLKLHLAQAYLPLAASGLFLGLSATTIKLLRYNGINLWGVGQIRLIILGGAALWSLYLAYKILKSYPLKTPNLLLAQVLFLATLFPIIIAWVSIFWF